MKSEKEKMLSGKPYQAFGKALSDERLRAKQLVFELNALRPDETEKQRSVFETLLGRIGKNVFIELPFRCDYGYNIEIGKNFFANYNCTILDSAKVTIGNHVMFGPNVSVFTSGHPVDPELRKQLYQTALPVTIGNNVWIGGNSVINPGVRIGDNAVIGSGSVVTKDIPSDVVAAGNPCREIRKITAMDRINFDNLIK